MTVTVTPETFSFVNFDAALIQRTAEGIASALGIDRPIHVEVDETTPLARVRVDIGDTIVVQVKIKEGDRERLQAFEGVVIGKRSRGLGSSFTVRKISHGVGVERTFQTHSQQIDSVTLKRRGDVRQAKLYYLRDLAGKAARITEKLQKKSD